jgi:hypothetical protein
MILSQLFKTAYDWTTAKWKPCNNARNLIDVINNERRRANKCLGCKEAVEIPRFMHCNILHATFYLSSARLQSALNITLLKIMTSKNKFVEFFRGLSEFL